MTRDPAIVWFAGKKELASEEAGDVRIWGWEGAGPVPRWLSMLDITTLDGTVFAYIYIRG